jgi:GTP cyclohydrolase FolE2
LINTDADTQNEPASIAVEAGVSGLKVLYQGGKITIPVTLSIETSTGLHRGVHMSRLVHAASTQERSDLVGWLRAICRHVNKSQPGCSVTCSFELPFADQFIPVSVATKQSGTVHYEFTAKGMTACPCSKKMTGVGHMQRAEIAMTIDGRKPLNMFKVVEKMEECFSAVPTEKMKRVEEAKKILEAQDHARFAEDLVRECIKRFPNAIHIRGRCFESIHAHDAIATWSRRGP